MARTIAQIQTEIITEKENQESLSGLVNPDSPSATAQWTLWSYVVAVAIYSFEVLMDLFKADVEAVASSASYGHDEWWVDIAKEFQYGDDLQIVEVNGIKISKYATIDPSKQIIKRASIRDGSSGSSNLKVAKEVDGDLQSLSSDEMIAFSAYAEKKRPSGANVTFSSNSPDLAKLFISIYYNPLLELDTIEEDVQAAINNYLANIDFNGIVKLSLLQDAIQAVTGVNDVKITDAQAKSSIGEYSSITRVYQTFAGYIKVDPDNSLDDTLTFIPE
jgi:hypothetical protein